MRPPSSEGGNGTRQGAGPARLCHFNEAALKRGRKLGLVCDPDLAAAITSMRPPSSEGGNSLHAERAWPGRSHFNEAALKRGQKPRVRQSEVP